MEKSILRITTVSYSIDLLLKGQLKYISNKGFDINVAFALDDKVEKIEAREEVKYFELKLTRTMNPIKDLVCLFNAVRLILKIKPAIVHSHSPKAGIVGMLAAWICRVPVKIHTVAGLPLVESTGLKKSILVFIERVTYFCADYVLPNSLQQKKYIEDNIYKGKKIQVIGKGSSNGIDLKYFSKSNYSLEEKKDLRAKLNIPLDNIVLCFVGRLANYKGINELVKAFKIINGKHNNLSLLLVGPYEDLNPLDLNVLDEINHNSNIVTVGFQNDVRPYLNLSDIFVFPSYREGFPQSLMQAAAMNLACVATDINGCNEIIEDKKTGLLIKSKDISAIVDAIDFLILNPEYVKKIAFDARDFMEKEFEQENFWNKLVIFYNDCLKKVNL